MMHRFMTQKCNECNERWFSKINILIALHILRLKLNRLILNILVYMKQTPLNLKSVKREGVKIVDILRFSFSFYVGNSI